MRATQAVVLGLILLLAVIGDLRRRRIPNSLTLPGVVLGISLLGLEAGWGGLWSGITGTLTGAGLLFLPFALGGMGAGDVKLMAAVGAFGGPVFAFRAFLAAALIGGAASFFALLRMGRLAPTLRTALWDCAALIAPAIPFIPLPQRPAGGDSEPRADAIPYGVAIALGAVISWFWQ